MQVLPLFKKAMGSNKEESADKDQKYTEKELRWIFDELDVLRTGQLRAESLSKVLERVVFAVTPKQAHRLVQEARGSVRILHVYDTCARCSNDCVLSLSF